MKIAVGLIIVIVLLVGGILSLPFLIDLNKYQDQYKPLIEEALNRKVQLQDIRLTIWPRLGARIGGFTVLDDPSFTSGPFASLTSLDVGVKLMPLLRKKIEVEEITLRDPVITVLKNKAGILNVSTIGPKTTAPPPTTEPGSPPPPSRDPLQALALLAVDRVSIDGGNLTYRDLSIIPAAEYQVQDLELLLKSVRLGQTPTLHLGATVQPYHLPVTLDGSFGPLVESLELKQYDFTLRLGKVALAMKGALIGGKLDAMLSSSTISTADLPVTLPLTKPIQIKDLRVVATAPYPLKPGVPAMELADVTDLGLALVMGSSTLHVKGTVQGGHIKAALTAPSVNTADLPIDTGLKKPVEVKNLEVNADIKGQGARLTNLSFQLFGGQVKAHGGMSLGSATPPFNGTVTVQGLQLGPALETVSSDSKVSVSGTAAMDVAVAGRGFSMPDLSSSLEGPGHMEVKDGKVEGVNLMQEVVTLLKIVGLSVESAKATAFSIVETDFMIKQGIVNVQKLLLDSHDFQATGNGTVGFDQVLNLAVNLNLSQTLSQKIAGSSPIVRLALKDGRLRLPLLITGTAQNPSYRLDMKGLTGKTQEQVQEKLKGAVEGLLQGTTKPTDLKKEGEDLLKGLLGK
ncbi:MAG TPA: AsmA family protein [Nitrospira sp.]|nr:AsmA family protein [Nitrospira sp.]